MANKVSPLKHLHISSCVTYANLVMVKEVFLIKYPDLQPDRK